MKRFLSYSLDAVDLLMAYGFSAVSIFYLIHMFGLETEPILLLTLLAVLLSTYCFRQTIRNLVLFLIAHIALIALIVVAPLAIVTKSVTAIYAVLLFISSMQYFTKLRNTVTIPMPLTFELLFIVCMIHNALPSLTKAAYVTGILYVAGYLLRIYLMNMYVFYSDGCATDYIPIRSILKRNSICTCSLIAVLLTVSLCLQSDQVSNFLLSIGNRFLIGFTKIIVFLFSLLPNTQDTASTIADPESTNAWEELLEKPSYPIIEFIADLIFYLLCFVLLCGLFVSVILAIYHFFQNHMHADAKRNLNDSDSSIIEFQERIVPKKKKEKEENVKGDLSRKVRLLYKKRIKQLRKKGYVYSQSHTPLERADEIKDKLNVDLHPLTKVYEQARYSCDPIHKNDINNL